jgi:hypothetical protein
MVKPAAGVPLQAVFAFLSLAGGGKASGGAAFQMINKISLKIL